MNKFVCSVTSAEGFYIGDICYALSRKVYDEVWGSARYKDGIFKDPVSGMEFAVAGTAHGDGLYYDGKGREYGVDAGVIGVVPKELATQGTDGGNYFEGAGTAKFETDLGEFSITLPDGEIVLINTLEDSDYDEEDYDDDEEDYDDE